MAIDAAQITGIGRVEQEGLRFGDTGRDRVYRIGRFRVNQNPGAVQHREEMLVSAAQSNADQVRQIPWLRKLPE